MVFGSREIARRGQGRTEVRPDALRTRLRIGDLTTLDSHLVHLTFSGAVQALDQPVERQMLTETFLGAQPAVTADEVMEHFLPALRAAAARVIETETAEHWLDSAARPSLIEALRSAARPIAFNCGVELVAPFDVAAESPTLQRAKLESMQRKVTERRTAEQAEHVARAAELLKQFQSMRDAAPGLSPGRLLERISPADRGSMLETLLMASAAEAGQTLYAVAGPNLVRIDARASSATPHCDVIPLPGNLGPLRSVQGGEIDGSSGLLIGAQSGVMFVDPVRPTAASCYADREVTSALGFNSVVTTGGMIWATHGEAGIVAWRIGEMDKPAFTLRPAQAGEGPRNATVLDARRILYSAGGSLRVADGDSPPAEVATGPAAIVALFPETDTVAIVRANGQIERIQRESLERVGVEQRAGDITSAAALPWLGSSRLLLATADGPIVCVGTEDALITQYSSVHRGFRALAAAADLVVGVSADRTRLILWKSWDGRHPVAEIHLAGVARHRVADICFA